MRVLAAACLAGAGIASAAPSAEAEVCETNRWLTDDMLPPASALEESGCSTAERLRDGEESLVRRLNLVVVLGDVGIALDLQQHAAHLTLHLADQYVHHARLAAVRPEPEVVRVSEVFC